MRAERQEAPEPRDEEQEAQYIQDELIQWLERDDNHYNPDHQGSASRKPASGQSVRRGINNQHLNRGEGSSTSRIEEKHQNGKSKAGSLDDEFEISRLIKRESLSYVVQQHRVDHRQHTSTSLPLFRKPAKHNIPLGLLKRAKDLTRALPAHFKQDHREEIKRFDAWMSSHKAKAAYFMLTIDPKVFF